jgi:hypothetical protein
MRPLRIAAAPMRKLSRHRRSLRPLLRLLRPRARAWPGPADLVAVMAAGGARAAGRGAHRRHLVGVDSSDQVTIGSAALRIRRRSCGVRGCDGRTMRTRGAAVGLPAASARVHGGTRCHPLGRASIAAPRRPGPQGRGPRAEKLGPGGRRCGARRPAAGSESRRPRRDRQPLGEYRWPPHHVGRSTPAAKRTRSGGESHFPGRVEVGRPFGRV